MLPCDISLCRPIVTSASIALGIACLFGLLPDRVTGTRNLILAAEGLAQGLGRPSVKFLGDEAVADHATAFAPSRSPGSFRRREHANFDLDQSRDGDRLVRATLFPFSRSRPKSSI